MSSNNMHPAGKDVEGSVTVDFFPFLFVGLLAANCKPLILFSR